MRIQRLRSLLVVAVAVLVAAGCLPPFVGPADAPKAVVIGDSLVFQAGFSGDIERTFTGRNWQVSMVGEIAGTTQQAMPNIADTPLHEPRAAVLNHATTDVNVVRFALASNQERMRADVRAALTTALDLLAGVPCVVVVTANERGITPGFAEEARRYNSWLVPLTLSRPNATVLDWTAWSTGHPEWFAPDDGVHLTDPGKVALADAMERKAHTCSR